MTITVRSKIGIAPSEWRGCQPLLDDDRGCRQPLGIVGFAFREEGASVQISVVVLAPGPVPASPVALGRYQTRHRGRQDAPVHAGAGGTRQLRLLVCLVAGRACGTAPTRGFHAWIKMSAVKCPDETPALLEAVEQSTGGRALNCPGRDQGSGQSL